MESNRVKAAVAAALLAGLAAAGIAIPGGGDAPAPAPPPPAVEQPAPSGAVPGEEGAEIARTLAAIESGAPLPHDEDGGTFENREGLLPERPLGYYREYTVATPGSPDRGARRLVIGEGGETYYTDDHYASFVRIDPEDYR